MSNYFENEEKIKNIERQLPDFEIYENMLDDYSIFIDDPIIPICIYHYNGSDNNVYSKYISKIIIPSVDKKNLTFNIVKNLPASNWVLHKIVYAFNFNIMPPMPNRTRPYTIEHNSGFPYDANKLIFDYDQFWSKDVTDVSFITFYSNVPNTIPIYIYLNEQGGLFFTSNKITHLKTYNTSPIYFLNSSIDKFKCIDNNICIQDEKIKGEGISIKECNKTCYKFYGNRHTYYGGDSQYLAIKYDKLVKSDEEKRLEKLRLEKLRLEKLRLQSNNLENNKYISTYYLLLIIILIIIPMGIYIKYSRK